MNDIEKETALNIINKIKRHFSNKTIKKERLISYLESEYKIYHQTLREFIAVNQWQSTTFYFSLSNFDSGRTIGVKSIEEFETYLKSEFLDKYVVIDYELFANEYYLKLEDKDLAIKCQEKEGE